MTKLHTKFKGLQTTLTDAYAERDNEVESGLLVLLAKKHLLTIGPPGTAKSQLAHDLSLAFGVPYFRKLFGKHTSPEEVFGPWDLRKLKEGQFTRVSDRMAQTGHIQFWDEIFKSSSAIRNDLLTLMNERLYDHGTDNYTVPLMTVFAASNELPDDSEESGAFFDRFLMRQFVDYIRDPAQFVRMLRMQKREQPVAISADELRKAQEEVEEIRVPELIERSILGLRNTLDLEEGILVSDRRWKESQDVIKAHAWMRGVTTATEEDLSPLQHILWTDPVEIKAVLRTILKLSNPIEHDVVDIMDQIEQIDGELREALRLAATEQTKGSRDALREQGIEWFQKCEAMSQELAVYKKKCIDSDRSTAVTDKAVDSLRAVFIRIGSEAMGLGAFKSEQDKLDGLIFGREI